MTSSCHEHFEIATVISVCDVPTHSANMYWISFDSKDETSMVSDGDDDDENFELQIMPINPLIP